MNNLNSEKTIYRGGPSQVVNINKFTICFLLFMVAVFSPFIFDNYLKSSLGEYKSQIMLFFKVFFFVPVIWAFFIWLQIRCHRYQITTERLMEQEGIFSKETNELELYRVKDITFVEPFALRMFGCGNVVLDTSDKSTPIVVLYAVKNGRQILDHLRHHVQIMRERKGVREID